MYALLRDYREGRISPVDIAVREPTEPLTGDEERALEFVLLCRGLREAVYDFRPLICAASFLAEGVGWRHKAQASRALGGLIRKGVISSPGRMPKTRSLLVEPVSAAAVLSVVREQAA